MRWLQYGLCVLWGLFGCSPRTNTLTHEIVSQAEQAWSKTALADYVLKLSIEGDGIETGSFVADVAGGEVKTLTRNGKAIKTDAFYSVPGLHEFLETELDIAAKPHLYFGQGDLRFDQRVRVDERGLPTDYRRTGMDGKRRVMLKASIAN